MSSVRIESAGSDLLINMSTPHTADAYDAAQPDPRKPMGRPVKAGGKADTYVHMRTTTARKNAWVKAAKPAKLAEWITEVLDREVAKKMVPPADRIHTW